MKTLVYSTAFGKPIYFFLAEEMVKSLRGAGYTGDIAILTDRPFKFSGGAKAFPINIKDRLYKASLGLAVDVEAYDKILFVDSDVVFARNPAPLFALEGIHISIEEVLLGYSAINSQFLTDQELVAAMCSECPAVNVGTILFPGSMAKEFLERWEAAWKVAPKKEAPNIWKHSEKNEKEMFELWDQAALQALFFRGEIAAKPIPREWVLMPALKFNSEKFSKSTIVIHFCGPLQNEANKQVVLSWMMESQDRFKLPVLCEQIDILIKAKSEYNPTELLMRALCREKKKNAVLSARLETIGP